MQRLILILFAVLIFAVSAFISYSFATQALVPETGQITSYGAGDDGALRPGVSWDAASRFTFNGNGTITDTLTGLIWAKNANCTDTVGGIAKSNGKLTWADALTWSNNLASGSCGLTDGSVTGDWRLPNVEELESLVDLQHYNPALPAGHPFDNVQAANYWSSSTYAYFAINYPPSAAVVSLFFGEVFNNPKAYGSYVWPVRGGQGGALALTVTLAGTGSGSVHSSPMADIACIKESNSGCTASFATGSVLVLSATPDGITSTFDGWSGDCTSEPCSVTMNADKAVTATFAQAPLVRNKTTNTPYATLALALATAASGQELLLLGVQHAGVASLNTAIILNGGWSPTYLGKSGLPSMLNESLTTLNDSSVAEDLQVKGQLIIQGGSLCVNNVIVCP